MSSLKIVYGIYIEDFAKILLRHFDVNCMKSRGAKRRPLDYVPKRKPVSKNSVIALFLSVFVHLVFFVFLKFMHSTQTLEVHLARQKNIRIEIHRRGSFAHHNSLARSDTKKKSRTQIIQSSLPSSVNTTVDKKPGLASPTANISKVYSLPETQEVFLNEDGYVHPDYPRKARISRQEGTLLVQIEVRNGILHKTELTESSGHTLLDETALKAIQKWQFRPVTISFVQRITFQLN